MPNSLFPQEVIRKPTWYENALLNMYMPNQNNLISGPLEMADSNLLSAAAVPVLRQIQGKPITYRNIWNALTGNERADWADVVRARNPRMNPIVQKVYGLGLNMLLHPGNMIPMHAVGNVARELQHVGPVWRSTLVDTVKSPKFPEQAPAQQVGSFVAARAKTGEIKPEEVEWSGLMDWLKDRQGKVTRQEVLDYLNRSNVQIHEVTKGASDSIPGNNDTRFQSYVLPGGENYRELLLTLPNKDARSAREWLGEPREFSNDNIIGGGAFRVGGVWIYPNEKAFIYPNGLWIMQLSGGRHYMVKSDGEYVFPTFEAAEQHLANKVAKQHGVDRSADYISSHWEEPNVLAHVRFNDRVDADGKKVLFLEEIQSDWHQAGRKKGYMSPKSDNQITYTITREPQKGNMDPDKRAWEVDYYNKRGDFVGRDGGYASEDAARSAAEERKWLRGGGVPDAPFKKSWPLLAMKRMIRYAAENGYDRIAWTTGDQQAARYKDALLRAIDEVRATKRSDGRYEVYAIKDGLKVWSNPSASTKTISDNFGKAGEDIINKANESPGKEITVKSTDMNVGGSGMRGFYDQILPSEVNKFFGRSAWGNAKVGSTKIKAGNTMQNVHSIDITPEMRAKATSEGMPLFSTAIGGAAAAGVTYPLWRQYEDQKRSRRKQ